MISVPGFPEALVGSFSSAPAETPGFEPISVVSHSIFADLTLSFECKPNIHGQEMMLVLPDERLS